MTEGLQLSSHDCVPFCTSGGRGALEVTLDNISRAPEFWLIRYMRSGVEFSTCSGLSVLQIFSVLCSGLRGAQSKCASAHQVFLSQNILLPPLVVVHRRSSQDGKPRVLSSLVPPCFHPREGHQQDCLIQGPITREQKRLCCLSPWVLVTVLLV